MILPGAVGNVGDWLKAADAFALTSLFEGYPNVLLEAMVYGLPVIAMDCDTGPAELIEHNYNGLLVPPGDMQGFESELDRLMTSQECRAKLSVQAKEHRERYKLEVIGGLWQSLFEKLLAS